MKSHDILCDPQIITEQKDIPDSFSMQPQTGEVTATTIVIRSCGDGKDIK